MREELVNKSKLLSLILRHKPQTVGLKLDANGWAKVSDIITNTNITLAELLEIVKDNDKQRFALNESGTLIRASQGHSIPVELNLRRAYPGSVLYHGTKTQFLDSIRKKGLQKQNRSHVHLSSNEETAIEVANRRKGKSVLLIINTHQMRIDGIEFFQSDNKVWLVNEVLPRYITYKYL